MKIGRNVLIGVFALSLLAVLSACGDSKAKTAQTFTEGSDAPKYGGKLSVVYTGTSFAEPVGWNIHTASSVSAAWWLNPVQEFLIQGDFLNKGPRGSNENGFNLIQAEWPADILTGWLLESWEWKENPMGVEMVVRKGVSWSSNAALGMEAREVTAEDVAFWINSYRSSPKQDKMDKYTPEDCAKVTGPNTVFVSFTQPFASWSWVIGYMLYANVYPPEQTRVRNMGWEYVTGTGPFVIKEFATGVGAEYTRNENWWAGKTTINGQTYTAPFVDTLSLPILGDISTAISALMSGEIDIMTNVPITYKETLETNCPELNVVEAPRGVSNNLAFNALKGPCADREFRRALMIGTDIDAITAMVEGGRKGGFPFSYNLGESIYTPIDKLPAEVAELYTYNPDRAIQMIKDSGHAGKTVVINYSNTYPDLVDIADVLADQWGRLGINVKLNLVDNAVGSSYFTGDGSTWEGVMLWPGSNSKTSRGIENERTKQYLPCFKDAYFNKLMDDMMADPDPARRDATMKEAAVYFMGNVEEFGLVETSALNCWWPWVKNYYGEIESGGTANIGPVAAYAWIDADLKASMGF
jgi:peptide/nickel transport system substrate-binding protein